MRTFVRQRKITTLGIKSVVILSELEGGTAMYVSLNDNKIRTLGVNEYFFLTENFEFADASEINSAMGFLVINKRSSLEKTVKSIIKNELDETERAVIKLYYYNGLDTLSISEMCNLSRSSVYRNLKSGLRKIENSIKYVLEYDGFSSKMSSEELVKYIKGAVS